jgi:hypothetical protein
VVRPSGGGASPLRPRNRLVRRTASRARTNLHSPCYLRPTRAGGLGDTRRWRSPRPCHGLVCAGAAPALREPAEEGCGCGPGGDGRRPREIHRPAEMARATEAARRRSRCVEPLEPALGASPGAITRRNCLASRDSFRHSEQSAR